MRLVRRPTETGFSLLELLVVLILLALAAALAAPALSRARTAQEPALAPLLAGAREAAARRGETVHLSISRSGDWAIDGAASPGERPIQSGRIDPVPGLPLTLVVSPIGSCGFDARSARAADSVRLDPLTCTLLD